MEKITRIRVFKNISVFLLVLVLSVSACARKTNLTTAITHDSQVPESEMVHIIFSLNWILANDAEPGPYDVKITFPVSWLTEAPVLLEGDIPIELSVPKLLLERDNESKNPEFITVLFPNYYFKGLPEPTETPTKLPQLFFEPPGINFFTKVGLNPEAKTLTISAIAGPIDWQLSNEAPWLIVSQNSGVVTGEGEIITVSVDTTGLEIGSYYTDILFTCVKDGQIRNIPVSLFVTSAEVGQVRAIGILPNSGNSIANGITIEQDTVVIAALNIAGSTWNGKYYDVGDLCLEINGKLRNTTNEKLYLTFGANGYDEKGTDVSWTLDWGPIIGLEYIGVPPGTVVDFTLHLSWAENVKVIKITGNSSPYPFGYSSDEPTTTSP